MLEWQQTEASFMAGGAMIAKKALVTQDTTTAKLAVKTPRPHMPSLKAPPPNMTATTCDPNVSAPSLPCVSDPAGS
eukprot:942849-Amphidinium_carterae.1